MSTHTPRISRERSEAALAEVSEWAVTELGHTEGICEKCVKMGNVSVKVAVAHSSISAEMVATDTENVQHSAKVELVTVERRQRLADAAIFLLRRERGILSIIRASDL